MAVILVLACSVLGFTSAVVAFVLFDASLIQAFLLWTFGGLGAVAVALLPTLLPSPEQQGDAHRTGQTESA